VTFSNERLEALPDVMILTSRVHTDERGSFVETWRADDFAARGLPEFVQDNQSVSYQGVLRGMHYQLPPDGQAKLVRVVAGSVFDAVVDVRRSSPTFGTWVGLVLAADQNRFVFIPEGFAHGFLTLSDRSIVVYRTSRFHAPASERVVTWDDPEIGIEWPDPGKPIRLSERDRSAPRLADVDGLP
jgi:dTDP-4-dehydrorhamnose 3,5-epimerase